MVRKLPGFELIEGDEEVRGFTGSRGNILFDGRAPTSKQETLEQMLRRIPASAVLRIELIRGGAKSTATGGYDLVANVIRRKVASTSASILAGASGYVLKQMRGNALADAIASVAAGASLLDPGVTQRVLERVRSGETRSADPLDALTEQEHRILTLIAEGKTNKEIAAEVYLSDKTVKNYVSSILTKLNLRRRSEAAAFIARREPGRQPDQE